MGSITDWSGQENFYEKKIKKVLTRGKRCDIIIESPSGDGDERRSLKIEQQTRKYKVKYGI